MNSSDPASISSKLTEVQAAKDEIERNYDDAIRKIQRLELDNDKLEEAKTKLAEDNKLLESSQNDHSSELLALRGQHDTLLSREDQLEDQLARKSAACEAAEREAEEKAGTVNRLNANIDSLESELDKCRAEKADLQNELDEIKKQLDELM